MAAVNIETKTERWKKAVVGPLSSDFLRISTPREVQEAADRQAALALYQQQQQIVPSYMAPNIIGRLSITIAQAKLVKNYGMTRMDPYVRIRVGHFVYETQTDPNGGKNPRWNRVIHSQLPVGVQAISLEIYDECSFTMDELIAWTEIKIPDVVLRGETHEEWYTLNGKQGDGLEGTIDLVFSFVSQSTAQTPQTYMYQTTTGTPVVMVPNVTTGRSLPVFVTPTHTPMQQPIIIQQQQQQMPQQPQVIQQPIQISEEDLKQISEMFPNIDRDVIKSVFEVNNGQKDLTINALLQMTEQ